MGSAMRVGGSLISRRRPNGMRPADGATMDGQPCHRIPGRTRATFAAMLSDHDPIVAIATAAGRSGIGIVRVSGRALEPVLYGVLGAGAIARLRPRCALRAAFVDAAGQAIDTGLALLFPAPNSYTGETVLELHGHGGPV